MPQLQWLHDRLARMVWAWRKRRMLTELEELRESILEIDDTLLTLPLHRRTLVKQFEATRSALLAGDDRHAQQQAARAAGGQA